MTEKIFVDTCYWIARLSPHDQLAERARLATVTMRAQNVILVTTDEVLTETLNGFAERGQHLRGEVVRFVAALQGNVGIRVIPQTRERWIKGQALYADRLDKGYSLTDCISMVACRDEKIGRVLTADQHFIQEGFTAMLI